MKKTLKKQEGFTLVELMVVVAIIGILSAVAIPNFKRYQAKSKVSEAKLSLAGVYTAMTTLQSDYDTFATCLDFGGFARPANNYYAIGFDAQDAALEGDVDARLGNAACTGSADDGGHYVSVRGTGGPATGALTNFGGMNITSALFIAGAEGNISADEANTDQWTIDQEKTLTNVQVGY